MPGKGSLLAVKDSLLALLADRPAGVYQLTRLFEERMGGLWPMNIGQVYQTMGRLQRDGLVEVVGEVSGETGRKAEVYGLTESGRAAVEEMWASPIRGEMANRDDLVMKILLAIGDPRVDMEQILIAQRVATLRDIRLLTDKLRELGPDDLSEYLLIQRRIFERESISRWLDHIEVTAINAQRKAHHG